MEIKNRADLKVEIARLEHKSRNQESNLLEKVHELQDSFTPMNIILSSLSSLTGIPLNKSEFVKKGAIIALTFFIQKFIRKSELRLETILANLLGDIKHKITDFFNSKNSAEDEEENETSVDEQTKSGN